MKQKKQRQANRFNAALSNASPPGLAALAYGARLDETNSAAGYFSGPMRKNHSRRAEESIDKIFGIIEGHLMSLPEAEAIERLSSIDQVHAKARAHTPSPRSKKPSARNRVPASR